MNKVFLSGTILGKPILKPSNRNPANLTFQLCVLHRTAAGLRKQEVYEIAAWHSTALWGAKNLRQGQQVILEGYLTRNGSSKVDGTVKVVAREFLLIQDTALDRKKASIPTEVVSNHESALICK